MKYNYELTSISFAITFRCNLKCNFCSRDAKMEKNIDMSIDFMEKVIDEALKFTNLEIINLTGGEPFLHPDFESIVKMIVKKGLKIRINSNGLCIDEERKRFLDDYNVRLFTFSLDSSIPKIHNELRGVNNCYEQTVTNIKRLKDTDYKYFIKATVNETNIDTIYDLMRFSYNELGAYGFSIGRTVPIGRAGSSPLTDVGFVEKFMEVGKKCSEFAKDNNLNFLIDDPIRFQFDVRVENFIKDYCEDVDIRSGCSAGCSFLYILPGGDALICPGLTLKVGNVNQNSLKEIWHNSEIIKNVRERDKLKGKCGQCTYKRICGGCRAYAYATTGDYLASDSFCPMIS